MITAKELQELKIENDRDRAVFRVYGIFRDRMNYYLHSPCPANETQKTMGHIYETAALLLEYAMTENWEVLNQFDYFGED